MDAWLVEQREMRENGTFFGASNYKAYLVRL